MYNTLPGSETLIIITSVTLTSSAECSSGIARLRSCKQLCNILGNFLQNNRKAKSVSFTDCLLVCNSGNNARNVPLESNSDVPRLGIHCHLCYAAIAVNA